jgi:Xaa-Pro dipeptidase
VTISAVLPNRARASSFMSATGIEAMVATSPANIRYLTGYWCWLAPLFREFMVQPGGSGMLVQENYALLPREGDPCLVIEPYWALNAVDGWVRDVRLAGTAELAPSDGPVSVPPDLRPLLDQLTANGWPADPIEVLAGAIEERGLGRTRIGVELEGMAPARLERLRRALPAATLLDCTNVFRLVRAVKTDAEIDLLARAAQIAEDAATGVVSAIEPEASTGELADRFRALVAQEGADLDHFSLSLDGLGFTTGGGQPLRAASSLYLDFGCIYQGWFSDSGTTLSIGEPGGTALEEHAAVRDAVAAGAAAIRPGVRGSAVQYEMKKALAERGITKSFPHGHGLGREVRDYPILVPDAGAVIRDDCIEVGADLVLEPNMVINLEAPVLTLGRRSVHCEQTFVVTGDGCRSLIVQDRAAPLVAGEPG